MSKWKLKRVRQCEKCPWKVSTDPREIPRGYSEVLHRSLSCTIANPDISNMGESLHVMACHEHESAERVHCVGWFMNQLGPGNNFRLRLRSRDCTNLHAVRLDGPQHERFEDTLPAQRVGLRAVNVTTASED